jgi:hypothetical protein
MHSEAVLLKMLNPLEIRNNRRRTPGGTDPRGSAAVARRDRRGSRGRLGGRGQTVVEFALILPVVLLLTVGIIDIARLFTAYVSLTNGVREAALYASSGGYAKWCSGTAGDVPCPTGAGSHQFANPDSIGYHVQGESTGLTLTSITVAVPVCDNGTCDATSNWVTVAATVPFQPLTPLITTIMGSQVMVGASTTAQIQK